MDLSETEFTSLEDAPKPKEAFKETTMTAMMVAMLKGQWASKKGKVCIWSHWKVGQ